MNAEVFNEVGRSLVGKIPWGVALGMDSMLTLEFGPVDPRQSAKAPHGEWHLWVYGSSWAISRNKRTIVRSEEQREKVHDLLSRIQWEKITEFKVLVPTNDLRISFADDLILSTLAQNSRADDEWLLYTPALKVYIASRGSILVQDSMQAIVK